MPRASNSTLADPALDAAALLRRLGFFGLFVVLPVLAQVARRASVILAPIAVILLIIASVIDRRQRPVRPAARRLLTAPGRRSSVRPLSASRTSRPRSGSPCWATSPCPTGCDRPISTCCRSGS
jgi:hypothetical protein